MFDITDNLDNFEIEWGDGSVEEIDFLITASAFHEYANNQTYDIKLIATKAPDDFEDVTIEIIKQITLVAGEVTAMPPVADFTYIMEDFASHVTFEINNSFSPTSEIVSALWDHGDGTTYSGVQKIHSHFYNPGVYIAKLTVTDDLGLQSSQSQRIVVTEVGAPVITIAMCEDIVGKTAYCEFVAVDKSEQISTVDINWGDGQTQFISAENPQYIWEELDHDYSEYGTYNLTIKLNTFRGESVSETITVDIIDDTGGGGDPDPIPDPDPDPTPDPDPVVNNAPTAIFSTSSLIKFPYSISASSEGSYDQDGDAISYKWYLNNNEISSDVNLSNHAVQDFGKYTLKLVVKDPAGLTGEHSVEITANANPKSEFICTVDVLSLNCDAALSKDEDGEILEYQWMINDEPLGSNVKLTKALPIFGRYVVSLVTIDNNGSLSNSYTIELNVVDRTLAPAPLFDYFVDDNKSITFDASMSLINYRGVAEYKWEFSNGETEITTTPKFVKSFNALTKFSAKLTVTDFTNQTASYEREITVYDLQVPDPKEAGEATLLGIDTDSDGVRDDVQRYIIARIKGFEAVLPVALNLAKYTQSLIENKDSQLMIDQLYKQRNDQYLCMISKMDSYSADVLFREIKAVSYNTKERLEAWAKINHLVTNSALDDRNDYLEDKYGDLCE